MGNIFKPPCDEGVIWSALDATPCGRVVGGWVLAATIIGSCMAFVDVAVVIILADGGQRYQSKLFSPEFLRQKSLPTPAWL